MNVFACNDINNLADALSCIRSIRSDLALLTSVEYPSKIFDDIDKLERTLHQLLKSVPLPPVVSD